MENIQEKSSFLKNEYIEKLKHLDANTTPKWGKMNVQQMIEHMSDYVRIANGRTPMEIITATDRLPAMRAFLEGEKQMRENTPNVLLPDTPPTVKHLTKENAIAELEQELSYFFEVYEKAPDKKIANPFFGELDFDRQVQLLHKHSTHHLRQFGVM